MDRRKERGTLTYFELLLALTALAFTTITAGVGFMQAYYAAHSVLATSRTNSTSQGDLAIIATQANILFPLGKLLVIVGLAIISSIFLQFVLQSRAWFRRLRKAGRVLIALLVGGIILPLAGVIISYSTYESLLEDFSLHLRTLPIFGAVLTWLTVILYLESKKGALGIVETPEGRG